MGFYVNASGMRKEEWLAKHGRLVFLSDAKMGWS